MNRLILFATILSASALVAATATASVVYDSPSDGFGPTGRSLISGSFLGAPNAAFDTFSLSSVTAITGVSFDTWTLHNDTVTDVSWRVLDLSKTYILGGIATPTSQFYAVNNQGFDIDINKFSVAGLVLQPGIYYVGLFYANSVSGRPVGWDQTNNSNSGYIPSHAQDNANTFQIFGEPVGVPEPATWALMIGGMGLAGATLRHRRSMAATA